MRVNRVVDSFDREVDLVWNNLLLGVLEIRDFEGSWYFARAGQGVQALDSYFLGKRVPSRDIRP